MKPIEDGMCIVVNEYGQYPHVCKDIPEGLNVAHTKAKSGGRWVVLTPHYSCSYEKELKSKLHNVKHESDVIKESYKLFRTSEWIP